MTDETRGVEATVEVHDEAAVWTDPAYSERARKLADVQKRYLWFDAALKKAHAEGKIKSDGVRFLIVQEQPLLYDKNGVLVLDDYGNPLHDWQAEPYYYGRAQAYSYVGDPTRTIAGQMEVSLQLLGRAATGMVIDVLCADLSALHARELARATV
jgi:hypothetical protein